MTTLKEAIRGVFVEHFKRRNIHGYYHDMSVLIKEGLEDGLTPEEMTQRLIDYRQELKEVNE